MVFKKNTLYRLLKLATFTRGCSILPSDKCMSFRMPHPAKRCGVAAVPTKCLEFSGDTPRDGRSSVKLIGLTDCEHCEAPHRVCTDSFVFDSLWFFFLLIISTFSPSPIKRQSTGHLLQLTSRFSSPIFFHCYIFVDPRQPAAGMLLLTFGRCSSFCKK